MSSDPAILSALSHIAHHDLRFFTATLVNVLGKSIKCYLGVGKHALFFIKRNLSDLLPGGEIFYAYMEKVVEDTCTKTEALLVLNSNRPKEWESPKVFVSVENRKLLVQHLKCCWSVDFMWRFGEVAVFPNFLTALTNRQDEAPLCEPFEGYKRCHYQDYTFFLREQFQEVRTAIQSSNTGQYEDSESFEISLHVHEPTSIVRLQQSTIQRDHVRWVAAEYKQMLTDDCGQYYVLRNGPYLKKMNLVDDIASWTGWELFLKTEDFALIAMILRRQYIAPLMDTAQDLCVLVKCPLDKVDDKVFLQEAHIIADTISSDQTEFSVYREFIQSKLDALRYDEETIGWMESHLKLHPKGAADLRLQAKIFLRSLLKLFFDDNPASVSKVYLDPHYCFGDEVEPWLELTTCEDPISVAENLQETEGIDDTDESADKNQSKHNWYKRLSRYFAFCVDGGILGNKYSLRDLVENKGGLTSENGKKVQKCIEWMLHMRLKDTSRPWFEVSITQQLTELDGWEFNDRVMIVLIETDYLRKLFGRKETEYSTCIAYLLTKPEGSKALKSAVCRLLIQTTTHSEEFLLSVAMPLLQLLEGTDIFLQTWASAALVNLTASQTSIKNMLMSGGIAQLCVDKLKTRDDDLIQY
eukprot:GEMP01013321.1.p1 GENE.GEMP01013321.1~~GEMP01013321.1.p1  ORF type:complete len:639 (+),score=119.06 GEMP01013321.1:29-1945(+)